MNSVYVPTQVVVLLRRLANVVGTFGISNQYLLHRQAKADEQCASQSEDVIGGKGDPKGIAWNSLARFKTLEWPSWPSRSDWRRAKNIIADKWTTASRDARDGMNEGLLRADTFSFTWLGRTITWSSMPSLQLNPNPKDPQDDPPPPTRPRPGGKQDQDPFKLLLAHDSLTPSGNLASQLCSATVHLPLSTSVCFIVAQAQCHAGLYGFDTRGPASFPSIRVHYWSNILKILRDKVGAEVIVTSVPGTGSIASRAARLDEQLHIKARGRGINLLAHSMGGLDSRYLITHLRPTEYAPLSLTTVSTPHRGSPFMDWCVENIGIGKLSRQQREFAHTLENDPPVEFTTSPHSKPKPEASSFPLSFSSLPSSFTTLLLSIVDSPAYSNLTTTYLNNVFNPATPDDPKVKYFSVASRLPGVSIWHPLWFPKIVLDEEWGNDGLVTVQSAKWGEFLGIMEGCDHWEMRGARGLDIDLPSLNNLSFSLSTGSDAWSILDWSRFVSAWKREERIERDAKLQAATASGSSSLSPSQSLRPPLPQDRPNVNNDDVVRASTDRLSTVFDWLIDQIPNSAKPNSTSPLTSVNAPIKAPERVVEAANEVMEEMKKKVEARSREQEEAKAKATVNGKSNELESKEDLERFYVALSRKMYDEGF
ncbi:Lipase 2 [Leucoagaricus sp. SymC.cos]|nr:Lipase 2 [Leucoagaricus sp. SymC.cos]